MTIALALAPGCVIERVTYDGDLPTKEPYTKAAAKADEGDDSNQGDDNDKGDAGPQRPDDGAIKQARLDQRPAKDLATKDQALDEHEAELVAVLAELEHLGTLDPELRQQLIADLRKTKPSLWQPTLQIYRAALTYRKHDQRTSPDSSEHVVAGQVAAEAEMSSGDRATGKTATTSRDAAKRVATASHADAIADEPDDSPPVRPGRRSKTVSQARYVETASPRDEPDIGDAADEADGAYRGRSGWQAGLSAAIAAQEQRTKGAAKSAGDVRAHAQLRMLYLLAGRRDDALRPIEGVSAAQQDFWAKTLYALDAWLDQEREADPASRTAEAQRVLGEALARLAESGLLTVKNLAFCDQVTSFGIYHAYDAYDFQPQQKVLLYTEIENFHCEPTPAGYVTALKSSYQILDSRGQRVAEQDFGVTEETCRNRRRDFFMRYFVDLPQRIYDGEYTLVLSVEDVKSQKIGQGTIKFRIQGPK